MSTKAVYILLIFFLFNVYYISAIEGIKYIDDYTYIDSEKEQNLQWYLQPVNYRDSSGTILRGAIWSSQNSEEIDALYYSRIEKDRKPFLIGQYSLNVYDDGKTVFWLYNHSIIEFYSNSEKIFPTKIIEAYLEVYSPSNTEEEFCNVLYPRNLPYTGNAYFVYRGDTIQCTNQVVYGREGEIKIDNLTFVEFKERINRNFPQTFTEKGIKDMYYICMDEGKYTVRATPLEGFMKYCYERIYSTLVSMIFIERELDATVIELCDKVRLSMNDNENFIENQKDKYTKNITDMAIDCKLKKEVVDIENLKKSCENWKEGDQIIAGCDTYINNRVNSGCILESPNGNCTSLPSGIISKEIEASENQEAAKISNLVSTNKEQTKTTEQKEKPENGEITKETSNEKIEKKNQTKIGEIEMVVYSDKEVAQLSEQKEKHSENILEKIISFFKRLFS